MSHLFLQLLSVFCFSTFVLTERRVCLPVNYLSPKCFLDHRLSFIFRSHTEDIIWTYIYMVLTVF